MPGLLTIGVDLGGTNIKGCVLSDDDQILVRESIDSQAECGPECVVERIVELIETLIVRSKRKRAEFLAVGIGSPGPLSHDQGVVFKTTNLPDWRNVPLRERVSDATGLPAVLDNDGNVAAYGEFTAGAGRGTREMVMLTLGTGVGGGIVIGGRVHRGFFENAGEIGHMIVVANGRACPCGQRGCLERYSSASAVAQRYVEAAGDARGSARLSQRSRAGEAITSRDVAQAAQTGDELAVTIWDEACLYLATACVNLQHLLNPEVVVLGGGLIGAGEQLLTPVRSQLAALAWKMADDRPRIEAALLGESAGSIGAAALARAEHASADGV